MAKKLKKKKPEYPGTPVVLSNNETKAAWFYTQPNGLLVVAELRPGGVYQGTTQTVIPWSKVLAAVKVRLAVRGGKE